MLNMQRAGNVIKIDIREAVAQGRHPKQAILEVIADAAKGCLIEVHMPHHGAPLVSAIKDMGLHPIVNQIQTDHYRLLCVKF